MSVATDTEEDIKEVVKPWVPRVITGGKGPSEPSDNWLGKLPAGTAFVTQANDKTVDFELYFIQYATPEVYLLQWQLPDGKVWDRHVNPAVFCKHYKRHVVLGYHKREAPVSEADAFAEQTEVPKEEEDGNRDRTD